VPEDRKERVDRELIEFLNEIRVVPPGAQVLFAFLLSLPFLARFGELTRIDRDDILFTQTWAAVAGGLVAGWVVVVWYILPLPQRRRVVE
jgi:hypothetical protein